MTEKIDTLHCGGGQLGLSSCPGARSDGNPMVDLERFRSSGASAVLTALDEPEQRRLRLEDLGDRVESLGMDWFHVPVPDFEIPGSKAEARWRYASVRLRRILSTGGSVVLHCRGGLGRTGMLAARLLVDTGFSRGDAVTRVREARPGAIETKEQLEHLLSQSVRAALPDAPTFEERVFGCLLGGAVGDGFGYPIEFSSLDEIRTLYGLFGLTEPVYDDGLLLVSDDTQMTMFTAEGLIRAYERMRNRGIVSTEDAVWRAYRRWVRTQGVKPTAEDWDGDPGWLIDEPPLRMRRAPGNTCLSVLRNHSLEKDGRPKNDSKGCGGVMRVAPVGLLPSFFDAKEAFRLGSELAALTHGHPSGHLSAAALAAMIRKLVDAADYLPAVTQSLELLEAESGHEETATAIRQALELACDPEVDPTNGVSRLGRGWVGEEALAIALFAAIRGRDFSEVVRIAGNHDGDSDSTASIAGQLRGACDGVSVIPQTWVRRLDVLDPLLTLAVDLAALSTKGEPILRRYPPN